jgi:3-phosphoshikimate 1-carboxyvinyltransferase
MTVAGLHCRHSNDGTGVKLDDASPVATSYPAFFDQIAQLQGKAP